jgi:hypothetical protein
MNGLSIHYEIYNHRLFYSTTYIITIIFLDLRRENQEKL